MIHRVMVVGCSGAGKSTITRALGEAYGLPAVHLDRHFWRPGWRASPPGEWERTLAALVAEDEWIHDGNYVSTMEWRLPRADLVVFVDTSRARCVWRVLKRRLRGNRVHDIPGCPERIDLQHFVYLWRFPGDHRVRVLDALSAHPNVVRLRTPRQVRRFVEALPTTPSRG